MMPLVSRETEDKLRLYEALLVKWQAKINLVSPATIEDSWIRHFQDSLQLLPLLPDEKHILYDLGTGGGFPGLVLAAAHPNLRVGLIESDTKKCAFLKTVSRETAVPVDIHNVRIERAARDLPPPDIVTARALASLDSLFAYVEPWANANDGLVLIFPKGGSWRDEVAQARQKGWEFALNDHASSTEPSARLLVITKLRKVRV